MLDADEMKRSAQSTLEAIEHCEKIIAPLRKRAVLAEAVCEALRECAIEEIPLNAREAWYRWEKT